jgi:hypothetical protein
MDPAAQVLNYGQSIFEGMKAQRTQGDEIVLFRPTENAARMRAGAARMSMVEPPEELFLEAVISTVSANTNMVPPAGKGSLYLRPLLLGTGPIVGLGPAPSFTFVCFGAAVGPYFKVRLKLFIFSLAGKKLPAVSLLDITDRGLDCVCHQVGQCSKFADRTVFSGVDKPLAYFGCVFHDLLGWRCGEPCIQREKGSAGHCLWNSLNEYTSV